MRRRPVFWAVLGLLLVAAIGVAAWHYVGWTSPPAAATEQAAKPAGGGFPGIPVEAATVTVGSISSEIRVIGSLRSNESVVIRPEIGGRIAEILFDEGQAVAQGATLFKLDQSVAQAELHQAQAALALSQENYKRALELFERKASSAANRDQALAALRADQATVELAQARLDKMRLVAPFDGVLGLRKVSVGDYVNPGQDLVNLENIEPLKVDFRVPEIHLGSLAVGQTITVTVDSYPGQSFAGMVYAIDPLVDANGRAVALRARIPNLDHKLKPGLFVAVALKVGQRDQVMLVPEQAIVPRGNDQQVFKVVDGKAVLTRVQTGLRRNAMVEVVSGLAAGDTVVTAGQIKLRDGMPVTVLPPQPQS